MHTIKTQPNVEDAPVLHTPWPQTDQHKLTGSFCTADRICSQASVPSGRCQTGLIREARSLNSDTDVTGPKDQQPVKYIAKESLRRQVKHIFYAIYLRSFPTVCALHALGHPRRRHLGGTSESSEVSQVPPRESGGRCISGRVKAAARACAADRGVLAPQMHIWPLLCRFVEPYSCVPSPLRVSARILSVRIRFTIHTRSLPAFQSLVRLMMAFSLAGVQRSSILKGKLPYLLGN
jgi:hypothetical protein